MGKSWDVTITFKDGDTSEYVFEGRQDEARQEAYLSCPAGSIKSVRVQEREE